MASTPVDIYIHDTYIVVAHFHYVVFAGSVFAIFAAIYHWFPKMFGRHMNETLGKIHFWGTFLGFNGIFIPLFVTGMAGDHRRIWSYVLFPQQSTQLLQDLRVFATCSMLFMLAFQPIFVFNFFWSLFRGEKAPANPWKANTLEWQAPSPPPHGNFAELPRVYRGPYEYSHPDRREDYWPQNAPA